MRSEDEKSTNKQPEVRDTPAEEEEEEEVTRAHDLSSRTSRRTDKRVQSHQDEEDQQQQQQPPLKRTCRHLPSDSVLFDEGRRRLSLHLGDTNQHTGVTNDSSSHTERRLGAENVERLGADSVALDQWKHWQRQLLIYDNLRTGTSVVGAALLPGTSTLHHGSLGPRRVSACVRVCLSSSPSAATVG